MSKKKCDGCHRKPGTAEHEYKGEVIECEDCEYTLCTMCIGHRCIAQQPCKGVGPCCGSGSGHCGCCENELKRRVVPNQWLTKTLGPVGSPPGDTNLHHNLARGTCRCTASNFREPYMDLEKACYHGAKGGGAYAGPYKPAAQIAHEASLMAHGAATFGDLPASERVCAYSKCPGLGGDLGPTIGELKCSRCKSVRYCSASCQKAAWPAHKFDCAPHVPPARWPKVSAAALEYRARHGHYPGTAAGEEAPPEAAPRPGEPAVRQGAVDAAPAPGHGTACAAKDVGAVDVTDGPGGQEPFAVGAAVYVEGLSGRAELNGRKGMVLGYDAASARCLVEVQPAQAKEAPLRLKLRPANLSASPPTEPVPEPIPEPAAKDPADPADSAVMRGESDASAEGSATDGAGDAVDNTSARPAPAPAASPRATGGIDYRRFEALRTGEGESSDDDEGGDGGGGGGGGGGGCGAKRRGATGEEDAGAAAAAQPATPPACCYNPMAPLRACQAAPVAAKASVKLAALGADRRAAETALAEQHDPTYKSMQRGQRVAYEAWANADAEQRIALARMALDESDDTNVDARVLLAEEAERGLDGALKELTRAVRCGAAFLAERDGGGGAVEGPQAAGARWVKQLTWRRLECRPYLRARMSRGKALRALGRSAEAADDFRAVVEATSYVDTGAMAGLMSSPTTTPLRPRRTGDALEARTALLEALLDLSGTNVQRWGSANVYLAEADALNRGFAGDLYGSAAKAGGGLHAATTQADASARAYFGEALVAYRLLLGAFAEGGRRKDVALAARVGKALHWGCAFNEHVAPYLLGEKPLPPLAPGMQAMRGRSEAIAYALAFKPHWDATMEAARWVGLDGASFLKDGRQLARERRVFAKRTKELKAALRRVDQGYLEET